MKVSGFLTFGGINIGLCTFSVNALHPKEAAKKYVKVYSGRRIAVENCLFYAFILEIFVPSPSWTVKSQRCTEDEIFDTTKLDAVVFNRILVFSSGPRLQILRERHLSLHSFQGWQRGDKEI